MFGQPAPIDLVQNGVDDDELPSRNQRGQARVHRLAILAPGVVHQEQESGLDQAPNLGLFAGGLVKDAELLHMERMRNFCLFSHLYFTQETL